MITWEDNAIIVKVDKYSEKDAIVHIFSENHGRQTSFLKGAFYKRNIQKVQVGNIVKIQYSSRLEENLGRIKILDDFNVVLMDIIDSPLKIMVLNAILSLLMLFPENEDNNELYKKTLLIIYSLANNFSLAQYVLWELDLLDFLGFGLDLSCCAITGKTNDLAYVSPKSGKAVSKDVDKKWINKLLPLPDFMVKQDTNENSIKEIKKGLNLTGFFLENYAIKNVNYNILKTRQMLIDFISEFRDG
ncbi:MAG: DNA repair protein RecO [Alphaproteobacteria bacterium]|nr:DNA repair protein RecO [Alphaproteobacteria bacterium]